MNIRIMLSQAKGSTRDTLRRTHLMERIGEDHVYMSTQLAVHDFILYEPHAEHEEAVVAGARTTPG